MPQNIHNSGGASSRLPQFLTVRDLITIISVAVSLAIAWGIFETRVALLEKESITMHTTTAKAVSDVADINAQLKRMELRSLDNQHSVDNLYTLMKKPLPRHTDIREYN